MMKPYIDIYELSNGREVKNVKPSGWASVVETGVVPGAGNAYTVELDNRILMNGTLLVKVDGEVMTVIPYGLSVGATEVGVSFDIPLLQFNSACEGLDVEVTYQPLGTQLSAGLVEDVVPAPVVKARGTVTILNGDSFAELTSISVSAGDSLIVSYKDASNGGGSLWADYDTIGGWYIFTSNSVSGHTDINWAVV